MENNLGNIHKIPFNKPFMTGKETEYIKKAVDAGKISGDGIFTKKCQSFFENRYSFKKVFLTSSCTDALEMAAILINTNPEDEIIMPSYTFVSTANAFALWGAKIKFADSSHDNPNIDVNQIKLLISNKTKAIVVIHYGGIACDMDPVIEIANEYNLFIIEDAAHAIDSYYKGKALGSIGHFGTFSFHETKNIISGEGGMLAINSKEFINRAEIVREKGTNRSAFFRGEVDKYNWVDIGSSYLPSDIIAAFLYAQLENLERIQKKRMSLWNYYYKGLKHLEDEHLLKLPNIPSYATNNGHLFYLICRNLQERTKLITHLRSNSILAVFHYLSLHKSPFYSSKHDGRELPNSDLYTDCLIRLPMYYELSEKEQDYVIGAVNEFYEKIIS